VPNRPAHRTTRAAVWLVLCLTVLGLPRFLVQCRHGCGPARLEFVHAPEDCCALHHGAAAVATTPPAAPVPGQPGQPANGGREHGCAHTTFPIELAPAPRYGLPRALTEPPPATAWTLPSAPPAEPREPHARPPATGPPRPERHSELIVCTVLRR